MKNIMLILMVILLGFIMLRPLDYLTFDEEVKVALPPKVMTEIVEINAKVTVTEDKRIVVTGTTNLPNSTSLSVSLENEKIGFHVYDEINVSNNYFSTSPLGGTIGIPDGHYTIEILMPLPFVQPEIVQAIIGKYGEYLIGPLVEGSKSSGKVVRKTISYSVGSTESIAQIENQHQDLVNSIKQGIKKLVILGQEMESVRNTEDLNKLSSCGNQMRANQSKAKQLEQRSKELPQRYYSSLRVATSELYFCVSCVDDALEECRRVEELLQEGEI